MGFGLSKDKKKAINDAFIKMEQEQGYTLDLSNFSSI